MGILNQLLNTFFTAATASNFKVSESTKYVYVVILIFSESLDYWMNKLVILIFLKNIATDKKNICVNSFKSIVIDKKAPLRQYVIQ